MSRFIALFVLFVAFSAKGAEDCSFAPDMGNKSAFAISEYGQVLGVSPVPGFPGTGQLWLWDEMNGLVQLNMVSSSFGFVNRLNNKSQVVGRNGSTYYVWDSIRGRVTLPTQYNYNVNNNGITAGLMNNRLTLYNVNTMEVVWQEPLPYEWSTHGEIAGGWSGMGDFMVNDNLDLIEIWGYGYYYDWIGTEYVKVREDPSDESTLFFDMNENGIAVGTRSDVTTSGGYAYSPLIGDIQLPSGFLAMAINSSNEVALYSGVTRLYDIDTEEYLTEELPGMIVDIADNGQYVRKEFGTAITTAVTSTRLAERPVVNDVIHTARNTVRARGSHIEPNARIYLDIPFPPLFTDQNGEIATASLSGIPDGTYHARVVNKNGCVSAEEYEVVVDRANFPGCGLIGIEPFLVLLLSRKFRRKMT